MGEAARCLGESEAGAKKRSKETRGGGGGAGDSTPQRNFPPGLEYEILQADAIVLQGLVHALR